MLFDTWIAFETPKDYGQRTVSYISEAPGWGCCIHLSLHFTYLTSYSAIFFYTVDSNHHPPPKLPVLASNVAVTATLD